MFITFDGSKPTFSPDLCMLRVAAALLSVMPRPWLDEKLLDMFAPSSAKFLYICSVNKGERCLETKQRVPRNKAQERGAKAVPEEARVVGSRGIMARGRRLSAASRWVCSACEDQIIGSSSLPSATSRRVASLGSLICGAERIIISPLACDFTCYLRVMQKLLIRSRDFKNCTSRTFQTFLLDLQDITFVHGCPSDDIRCPDVVFEIFPGIDRNETNTSEEQM
jgi:hypothetical protein